MRWVNEVLSDQQSGGFYASQDADVSLDDDGDYFTWTLEEVRAVLNPEEARIVEMYYDVEVHGEMHHNSAKNVLWVASNPAEIGRTLGLEESTVRLILAKAKRDLLTARLRRTTPYIDRTMYVSWNAMFVSAYLEAGRTLPSTTGADCRAFALKTLDRMLREVWTEASGFGHRLVGPALAGSLDDQVFGVLALLDAYEDTLDVRYFTAAQKTMDLTMTRFGDGETGGFFDRATNAPPMGGLDMRRKPFQDSPTPGANSVAAIALVRLHALTGDERYYQAAKHTLETFAGIAPKYGLFASSYGLAATLFANHPLQVVVTGAAGDPAAKALEDAAHGVFRFGKSVLRLLPGMPLSNLPPALKETLPHLPQGKALAVVCAGQSCLSPTSGAAQLVAILERGGSGMAAGS